MRFLKTFQLSFITLVVFVIITTIYSLSKYTIIPQVDNDEPENVVKNNTNSNSNSNSNSNTIINHDGSGSACLLIKDDNSRLIEWLAYHYTMLPLRHLIIAVDPDSKTTPHSILKRWDNTDLNYMIWDDNDYMNPLTMMKRRMAYENKIKLTIDETTNLFTQKKVSNEQNLTSLYVGIHRERQRQFLSNCYRHHKSMNHTWVMHVDTDEYVLFNTIPPDAEKNDEPTADEFGHHLSPKVGRKTLPKLGIIEDNNKTIIDLLDKRRNVSPCIGMIRLLFGDKISTIPAEQEYYNNKTTIANSIFDLNSFDTLKFNYHHMKGLYEPKPKINGLGKVIVDVSQISYKDMDLTEIFSVHRPILDECPGEWMGPVAYVDSLLRVNHYLGSWEAYTARIDIRRSREVFNYRANTDHGPSYDIRPWLESFVNGVGTKEAIRLLDGTGKPFVSKSTVVSSSSSSSSHIAKVAAAAAAAASSSTTSISSETAESGWPPKRTCALLFFGIGRKFKDISYPSIKTNLLDINPDCDVFVHTYNIKEAQGSREGEGTGTGNTSDASSINPKELLLLVNNGNNGVNYNDGAVLDGKIIFETESAFERRTKYKKYRAYFPEPSAWEFPSSMDNMIRQWHSIAGVWRLMRLKETKTHNRYDRVGLFRPDVFYTQPISIMGGDNNNATGNEHAVIPSMMYNCTKWCGYNDRMFYGKY